MTAHERLKREVENLATTVASQRDRIETLEQERDANKQMIADVVQSLANVNDSLQTVRSAIHDATEIVKREKANELLARTDKTDAPGDRTQTEVCPRNQAADSQAVEQPDGTASQNN